MDWFVLIFLVPLILVPIVLLCGFAGCDFPDVTFAPDAPTTTPTPANFTATANGTDKIDLEWQHTSPTAKFTVTRTAPTLQVIAIDTPKFSLTDPGLNDGTDFAYALTAKDGAVPPSNPIEAKATTKPNAPTNLVATVEDVNKIVLTWNHVTKSPKNIRFKIRDTLKTAPGSTTEISTSATKDPTDPTRYTYPHTVDEGSEHEYQVTAVVDGFDNSQASEVMSNPSVPPVSAITSWKTVYNHPLTTNEAGFGGSTIVQRIDAANLTGVGSSSKIRVGLRGSTAAILKINKVTISQAVAAGQAWNSTAPITPLLFGGASGVTIPIRPPPTAPPTPPTVSDKTNYTFVAGKDLIIAFDINPATGSVGKLAAFAGPNMYSKANVTEAMVLIPPNRTAGYTTHINSVYIVEKIEVL
jgi:hypothetical protein